MGTLWKFNLAAYGLSNAAVDWYTKIIRKFDQLGIKKCSIPHCFFYATDQQGNNIGLLSLQVGDMLLARTDDFHAKVKISLKWISNGPVKKTIFDFLGMKINTETDQESRALRKDNFHTN